MTLLVQSNISGFGSVMPQVQGSFVPQVQVPLVPQGIRQLSSSAYTLSGQPNQNCLFPANPVRINLAGSYLIWAPSDRSK